MTADESCVAPELDALFSALAHRHRRVTLDFLRCHRRSSLADLAEFVACAEADRTFADLSAERVRDVYLALYYRHVPTLEDANLVAFDRERDVVAIGEDLEGTLRTARGELAGIAAEGVTSE